MTKNETVTLIALFILGALCLWGLVYTEILSPLQKVFLAFSVFALWLAVHLLQKKSWKSLGETSRFQKQKQKFRRIEKCRISQKSS